MECPGMHDESNPPVARRWHELGDIPGICHQCADCQAPRGTVPPSEMIVVEDDVRAILEG